MDQETQQIVTAAIAGLVRHALTIGCGYLVASGLMVSGDSTNFVNIAVGVIMGAVALGWSYAQKHAMVKAANDKSAS